uniref:Thioredoxin domain-containing protein n=2 Tax=Acrobeloides nanus TaxID=290746 RepID=A0A914BUL5_9BILA
MNDKIRLIVDDTGSTVVYNPTCYPVKRPPPRPNKLACWVKFMFITFTTLLILGVYFKPWIFAQIEDFRARNRQTEAQKTYKIESNDGDYLLNFGKSNSKAGFKELFDKCFKDMKTSKPLVEKVVSYRGIEEFVLNSKILVGTSENFDDLVSNGRKLVLFYAPWCRYSKEVRPNFNAAARSLLNGDLIAVNCDEQEDLCELLEIDIYPSFYVYEDGELILKDFDRTISDFRRAILAPKSDLKALAAKQENEKRMKKLPSEELDLPKQNVKYDE